MSFIGPIAKMDMLFDLLYVLFGCPYPFILIGFFSFFLTTSNFSGLKQYVFPLNLTNMVSVPSNFGIVVENEFVAINSVVKKSSFLIANLKVVIQSCVYYITFLLLNLELFFVGGVWKKKK